MNRVVDMSINPREYDVGELRDRSGRATNGDGDEFIYPAERRSARSSQDALSAGQYRELLLLQSRHRQADHTKPYLETLPGTPEAERTVFEWLEFLMETGGYKRTCDALRHYRSLDWITESVEHTLRDYLTGVPEVPATETRPYEPSDHLTSLIHVGRLAAV